MINFLIVIAIFFSCVLIIDIIVKVWTALEKKSLKEKAEIYKLKNKVIVPKGKVSCINCKHYIISFIGRKYCFCDDSEKNIYTGEIIREQTGLEKNINGECKFYIEKNWENEI